MIKTLFIVFVMHLSSAFRSFMHVFFIWIIFSAKTKINNKDKPNQRKLQNDVIKIKCTQRDTQIVLIYTSFVFNYYEN